MAKKDVQENVNTETEVSETVGQTAEKTAVEKVIFNVDCKDGVIRNFGARANILTNSEISETGDKVSVIFAFRNGEILAYTHTPSSPIDKLSLQMIAEGIASKAKSSVSGVKDLEQAIKNITEKLDQFSRGLWINRVQGGLPKESEVFLNKTQTVWARLNGYDTENLSQDAIANIIASVEAISAEDLKRLKATKEFKIGEQRLLLEIANKKLAALEVEAD